jgi:hypothetical protein
MCYFLYLASPLTLSEVRSMLPPGLTADPAPSRDQQILKSAHPGALTVVRLLSGRCSCDLVRPRLSDSREDERHLRERYRREGASRAGTIRALERHRRPAAREEGKSRSRAVTAFVAEHARNAGPSLYYLHFSSEPAALGPLGELQRVALAQVLSDPEGWLGEESPTLVSRS